MSFWALLIEQFRGWRTSEIAWLAFSISSIIALSVHWGDSLLGNVAAVTGMMYTILAGKGKLVCFIFGLINTPLYAYTAFKAGYYGDFTLNIYYFAMMVPGLVAWQHNQSKISYVGIVRTRLTSRGRLKLAGICSVGILALWPILHLFEGNRPFFDSVTTVLSISAMLLTVRRAIEEWVLWIIVDAIEIFMWWHAWNIGVGTISVLLMWILFLANGIYLLLLWMRIESNHKHSINNDSLRKS